MATANDSLTLAQALISDVSEEVYTDAVLLTFLKSNYRQLQRKLTAQGISTMRAKTTSAESAGATTVTQPADLIAPYRLWEKVTGTADDTYVSMLQVHTLPNLVQDSGPATYWAWEDDIIKLIGSSTATTYKLEYEQSLTDLAASTDNLLIKASEDVLGYMTAADAAASRGATSGAAYFRERAEDLLNDLIRNQVKVNSRLGFRQAPYGRRYS